ncbi:hypothetical protein GLX30_16610 [Streptomyces sp. Tu 2975]|uniref:hypothetical protein n=1 Tax=Streptomyces sp. Tu 2975 TaxID=2676871 RepID=UPI0013586E74|nr:hypothetical protein [Streptomyces sp. Tu 2975]QIP85390.1 hypothetical protein GLX30_16610 [Streptomyces sp. Tu 2975]
MARSFTRLAVVGTAAATMLAITASPALAADQNRTLSDSHGKMTYNDSVDVFEICDTSADGRGVSGGLTHKYTGGVQYTETAFTINDGGDAGCDKIGYNVQGWPHNYVMYYKWDGGGTRLNTAWFTE